MTALLLALRLTWLAPQVVEKESEVVEVNPLVNASELMNSNYSQDLDN